MQENKYLTLPEGLFKEYTNYKPKFEESYSATPVFIDGRWIEANSLFGLSTGGMNLTEYKLTNRRGTKRL